MAQIIPRRSTVTSTYLFRKIPSEFFGNNTRYRRELAFQRTHRAIKYGFISGKPLHSHLFYHWAAYKTVQLIKCRFLDWLLRTSLQTHDWQWLLNWITYLRVRSYVRPNNLHHVNQQMADYKMAWGIFDMFFGFWEILLWTRRTEYLPIFVTWESLKEEVFEISRNPSTHFGV